MSAEQAIAFFEQNRPRFISDLMDFLRSPTISAQPEHARDLRDAAEWIRDQLAAGGLDAQVMPTAGHPVVFADSGPATAPDGPTLLFYGHYDVQPAGDESLWGSPPFEPTFRDGAIYARGSADDKGQIMTHLAAMRCWKETDQPLPVRVKFLIEGEEEIGSPNLPTFVREHADLLACDYVVLSDTAKLDATTPAMAYSSRGLVYKQVTVHGPRRDLHSGQYGGAVANPANVLARIIAGLHDDQGKVTIEGFYDDVLTLDDDERARINRFGIDDPTLLSNTGSPAAAGEAGFTTAERIAARPTLDVNGLVSGYTAAGSSTIIPHEATAKISMRLVARQDADRIAAAFDQTVRELCPPGVTVTIADHASCGAYTGPTDTPGMQAALAALRETFGADPALTREGGSLPILPLFKQVLDADSIMLGFAVPDCNLHSPDEFFHVTDFENGTRCILRFLEQVSREAGR